MDKTAIKNYAIFARRKLIQATKDKCATLGITEKGIDSPALKGNGFAIYKSSTGAEVTLNSDEISARSALVGRIERDGFDPTIEEIAYTWFNRIIAIRFMEVNNYLPSRTRVLSSETAGRAESDLMVSPFDVSLNYTEEEKQLILKYKSEHNIDELFHVLFIRQCKDLSEILPGLFEEVDNFKDLLFNIKFNDKDDVVYRLTHDIPESNFDVSSEGQVEIIGWLYQFYNTEFKDKVMGRKSGTRIKKDEVPAVTQLFTPDWIVRYMVENSLGRLWLDGHEDNGFKSNWKYYLDEAEQEPAVLEQLKKIREEHRHLNLEDIKFIDPCMGSGHILVYAFDVFMQLYESEGYDSREAAKLILENNLYGLDIDERAYQLAYFALMMKGREYSRRIFNQHIELNLMAIKESNGFNIELLDKFGDLKSLALRLVHSFEDAKEYGSILNVNFTESEIQKLNTKVEQIQDNLMYGDLMEQVYSGDLLDAIIPLIKQATIMSQKYDTVVTNPPYMPISNGSVKLQNFAKKYYPDSKTDLFAIFMEKANDLLKKDAYYGMINMHSWMFLSSYEKLRSKLLKNNVIINMAHLGARAFDEIGGEVVQTTAFINQKNKINNYFGTYVRLTDIIGESEKENLFISGKNRFKQISTNNFAKIPGSPIAYWISDKLLLTFIKNASIRNYVDAVKGLDTCDNNRFTRVWFEPEISSIGFNIDNTNNTYSHKWYPYCKGGEFKKWYGNNSYVVDWENDGLVLRNLRGDNGKIKSRPQNIRYYFNEGLTWSTISSYKISLRYMNNSIFGGGGSGMFSNNNLKYILAFMNSNVALHYLNVINPTLNILVGDIMSIPLIMSAGIENQVTRIATHNISTTKDDWDSFETSWDFTKHPLVKYSDSLWDATGIGATMHKYYGKHISVKSPLELCYLLWQGECNERFNQLKENEEELNRIFIDIYGLQDELDPFVEDKDVTVRKANLTRDIKSFISYAVGCMFGRYSLNVDGLAYAGGEWDDRKYSTFIPDADNIIPIRDEEYFEKDDIVSRFEEFVKVVYGEDSLEANLTYIADALPNSGNSAREVIRNYFVNDFFKDHCQTYQVTGSGKRPIYWLFSSGKQNGFKALIYMHRYDEDIVGRVRTDYLHKVQSIYEARIKADDYTIDTSSVKSDVAKARKHKEKVEKQLAETRLYDQALAHVANQRVSIDLDDGVKVNYAKFQEVEVINDVGKKVKIDLLEKIK